MQADTPTAPGPASPPDPPSDQPGETVPEHIVYLLHAARMLLGYGRHLLETLQQRATAPAFAAIFACFGTAQLATIIAHLNRGILRAAALERMLLARAATGRDIPFAEPRDRPRAEPAQPAPADPQAEPPAKPKPRPKPEPRSTGPTGGNPRGFVMPTRQEIERQVRRRPVGRTIAEICLDLGVMPRFCKPEFWNGLFELITYFGSSVTPLMREKFRREQAFIREQDLTPGSNCTWWDLSRDAVRQVLGFFIGETPVNPFAPDPTPHTEAYATGPP